MVFPTRKRCSSNGISPGHLDYIFECAEDVFFRKKNYIYNMYNMLYAIVDRDVQIAAIIIRIV